MWTLLMQTPEHDPTAHPQQGFKNATLYTVNMRTSYF